MAEGGILSLVFDIAADPSEAEAAMAEFSAYSAAEATELSNIWSGAMSAITGPVGIALGGVMGLGGGMLELANKAGEFGEQMLLDSEKTGVAVESLSGLRIAAQMTGISFDDVTRGLEMAARNLSPFAGRSSQATKALASLGITATDSHGQLKPMDEILREVADKFKVMPDGTLKTADAMAIFGRSGAALIPILDQGSEGLARFLGIAQKTHQFMTHEQAEASEKFEVQWKIVKDMMDGVGISIGNKMIPQLTHLMLELQNVGLELDDWKSRLGSVYHALAAVFDAGHLDIAGARENWAAATADANAATNAEIKWALAMENSQSEIKKDATELKRQSDAADAAANHVEKVAKAHAHLAHEAHYVYPRLRTIDEELREITRANYDKQLHGIAEAIMAIRGGTAGAVLSGKVPGGQATDPFGTMAQSLNQAIVPLNTFVKGILQVPPAYLQILTPQQRIITNLKLMAQGWTENVAPMMKLIQQFGVADVAVNQFANTAWAGITKVSDSLAQSAANALVYGQNFGKAMEQAVKSEAASIASEAILWVLKCTALGLYYLAVGDGPDASLAFESAGVWAAIGGAAAGVGAAIPGGGGGTSRGAPNTTSGTPRGLGGVSGNGGQPVVNVYVQGVVSPDTIDLLAPTFATAIGSAIQGGLAPKWGTGTVMVPNRTAGK